MNLSKYLNFNQEFNHLVYIVYTFHHIGIHLTVYYCHYESYRLSCLILDESF